MKKTFSILAILFALTTNADVLYWMMDTDSAGQFTYDTAVLKYTTDNTVDTISLSAMSAYGGSSLNGNIAIYQGYGFFFESDVADSGLNSVSFFVELYNGESWVAKSDPIAYSALAGNIFKGGVGTPATPATFGTYAVPEPTSGLLFLVGGMLLGLKRRRQKV